MTSVTPPTKKPSIGQRFFRLAQWVWIVLALLAVAVLILSLPTYFQGSLVQFSDDRLQASGAFAQGIGIMGKIFSFAAAAISLGLAGLLYWKKRDDRMALFLSYFFLLYGTIMAGPLERAGASADLVDVILPAQYLMMIFVLVLLYIFPSGAFVPAWSRWLVWIAAFFTPLMMISAFEVGRSGQSLWDPIIGALLLVLVAAGFYGQIIRYRRISSPQEKLQTKWVVYGLGLWILVIIVSSGPYYYLLALPPEAPIPEWVPISNAMWWLGLTIVPITFAVAVLRHRLWDIDLLINRTLVYGALTAILILIYFGSVVLLQAVFTAVSGQQSPVVLVVSTLVIAALFNPLRRRVQATIDRRFYRRKYDAAQTLAQFAITVRDEVDLDALTAELVKVIEETMQPERVTLWLKERNE